MIHNHGQSLESFVESWFKQIAYSIILLRNEGYPCVFYGDMYGIPSHNIQPVGDEEHLKSGLAVIISNAGYGEKRMYIGKHFTGKHFIDRLGNCEEEIIIDEEGFGNFKVNEKSVSVYIKL